MKLMILMVRILIAIGRLIHLAGMLGQQSDDFFGLLFRPLAEVSFNAYQKVGNYIMHFKQIKYSLLLVFGLMSLKPD